MEKYMDQREALYEAKQGSPSTPGITGYRNLTDADKELMNAVKAVENSLGVLVDEIRGTAGTDQRWLALGVTSLQVGFMQVVRAIAQPASALNPPSR